MRVAPVLLLAVVLAGCAASSEPDSALQAEGSADSATPAASTPSPSPAPASPSESPSSPGPSGQPTPSRGPRAASEVPPVTAVAGPLTGTLRGDGQLEGGCAWLETAGGQVQVQYPSGYTLAFDPVRLLGPDGAVVASEGEQVTVIGRREDELMSFCQVGPVFLATEVGD